MRIVPLFGAVEAFAPQTKNTRKGCFGRGRKIRTFGMTESESVALPLGDTPKYELCRNSTTKLFVGGRGSKIRTCECESQSLVPYRLAIPLYGVSKGIRTLGLQGHNLAL